MPGILSIMLNEIYFKRFLHILLTYFNFKIKMVYMYTKKTILTNSMTEGMCFRIAS